MLFNRVIFDIAKYFIIALTPIVFLVGLLLLTMSKEKYAAISKVIDTERGFTLRIIPWLEKNIYSVHKWLEDRQSTVGAFLIIYAIVLFIVMINK